jgi:acetylornithine deacetylase/succinyl-diaminopimelate desuccinylase-like protein
VNSITEKVLQEIHRNELVDMARAICDVPSPTGQEAQVAALLQSLMKELGMRTMLQEVEDGRSNVIGTLEGRGGGRTLMFNGHLDTSFPFLPGASGGSGLLERPLPSELAGDWLYGTGAENMKSSFACYLGAVEALQRAGLRLNGDIVVAGVVGEIETSPVGAYQGARYRGHGQGTRHLVTHGALADYCVLGEPTGLNIGIGSCGTVWAKITTTGPTMGSYVSNWETNAVYRSARLIEALRTWRAAFIERHQHPEIKPSVTISAVEGGWPWRAARTAGSCSIYVDVRTAPDQPLISVKNELIAFLRSLEPDTENSRTEVEFYASVPGFEISRDSELVKAVQRAHTTIHQQPAAYRYSPAVDDGSHLSRYGIPTVVYGPGGKRREISDGPKNEYVFIDNLVRCAEVYALIALEACK